MWSQIEHNYKGNPSSVCGLTCIHKHKKVINSHQALKENQHHEREKTRGTEERLTLETRRWLGGQTRTYTLKNNLY